LPLFVCLLHEIFREGWQRASEQMIKLWWQFGSQIWIGKLVRRALVETLDVYHTSTQVALVQI